jgi:hypothetical protein
MKSGEILVIELFRKAYRANESRYKVKLASAEKYCLKHGYTFMVLSLSDLKDVDSITDLVN